MTFKGVEIPKHEGVEFDIAEKSLGFFKLMKEWATEGSSLAHGFLVERDGGVAMLAIDTSFFENLESRARLGAMIRMKAREMNAVLFVKVCDAWRLNISDEEMKALNPPPGADLEWLAQQSGKKKQDCLHGSVETRLGCWIITLDYEKKDGKIEWAEEAEVSRGRISNKLAIFDSRSAGSA